MGDHTKLFKLVRKLLETTDEDYLRECIQKCHNGELRGPINQENLHLFRRFRNDPVNGSGSARKLIDAAKAAVEDDLAVWARSLDLAEYRVEVNVHNDKDEDTWSGNRVIFYTPEEGLEAARDLFTRWGQVRWWRVVDQNDKVYHTNKHKEGS